MKNLFRYQFTLFIFLLVLWNLFFPIFEGADEMGHFCSADYIAHQNKIPNVLVNDGCFIWHPPLYYALLSPIIKVFNLPQFEPLTVQQNPRADRLRKGEYAQLIHDKNELTFRWNPLTWEIHTLRLFTSVFAVLMFVTTWRISKVVFTNVQPRYLSMLLFFNPMFIHIFTTITNVTLISLISTLVIAIDIFRLNKKDNFKWALIQGALTGLGFITKITAVTLIPAWLLVTYLYHNRDQKPFAKILPKYTAFFCGVLLTAGWYIVRNLLLYGELIETSAISKIFGESHHDLLLEQVGPLNYINSIFISLFKTFWSSYGALTVRLPEIINVFILILTILVIFSVFTKRHSLNRGLNIAVIYALSMSFGLFIMNFKLSAMHAKDLFPAYMPYALLFGYGLFQAKTVVERVNLKIFKTVSLIIGSYLFAQVEIVKFIKAIIQLEWNRGALSLFSVAIKSTLVFAIINIVIITIRKTKLNLKSVIALTFAITMIDISLLFISVYLLYKNFI